MARNKHPEETVEKILAVSAKLFMEKGYEHTTLQDIIDNLGGLTKGAIYHHFKGKEEILLAIADRMGEQTEAWMRTVRDDPGLTGAEKLQKMFRASLENSDQTDLFVLAPNMLPMMSILLEMIPAQLHGARPAGGGGGRLHPDGLPGGTGGAAASPVKRVAESHDLPCHAGEDPPPHGAIRPDAAEHGPGPAGSGAVESVGAILPPVPGTAVNNRRNCPTGQLLFHINTYQPNV